MGLSSVHRKNAHNEGMSIEVSVSEATMHFAQLLQKAIDGEVVTITQAGCPVVQLTQFVPVVGPRVLGTAKGDFVVPDDFDQPLPSELQSSFEK